MKSGKRKTRTDLVLLGLLAVCAYFLAFLTDAYEWFERWAGRHEEWQADEILMLLALLSAAAAVFAWRRWKEANTEIVRREELQKELEHRATHDALTELPNRALLMDRLEHAMERGIRGREMIAVLFVDLDGFKDVNDVFGHGAGDGLLEPGDPRHAPRVSGLWLQEAFEHVGDGQPKSGKAATVRL